MIAGSARGRQFDALPGLDTRPTLDRVKEAVFGSLQFDLPGSHVLDLFSGSGNLGLEAASRGASLVVCNDQSPACAQLIRKNARDLRLMERVTVLQFDYRVAIERLTASGVRFDFAFLDPPYASGFGVHAAADELQAVPGVMRLRRTKKFGKCAVSEMEYDDSLESDGTI